MTQVNISAIGKVPNQNLSSQNKMSRQNFYTNIMGPWYEIALVKFWPRKLNNVFLVIQVTNFFKLNVKASKLEYYCYLFVFILVNFSHLKINLRRHRLPDCVVEFLKWNLTRQMSFVNDRGLR